MNSAAATSYALPEILAPAGNLEKFRSAILYGANAVYLGGQSLNLRASSQGLSMNELRPAVREAEARQAKIFYCLNSLPLQDDLPPLPGIIEEAAACGVHAFIVADPGALRLARRHAPEVPVHLSTQANTTNSQAVEFWLDQGVSRVNLARELSWRDILAIRKACPQAELEVFVQGAMCLALSGQCLLSAWLNSRSANLGRCTQPCRFEYRALSALSVEEALRPGEHVWDVTSGERYSAFWAPEDLCLLPYLPWFVFHGLTALKIEGRMKSAAYVAHVADVYSSALHIARQSLRVQTNNPDAAPEDLPYDYSAFLRELLFNSSRPLSSGFFLPDERRNVSEGLGQHSGVVARVLEPLKTESDSWLIDVKENWDSSASVAVMLPGMRRPLLTSGGYAFENHRGEASTVVTNGTRAVLRLGPNTPEEIIKGLQPGIFIRSLVQQPQD